MLMPNFFIIGATKSGTTSLHHYLQQHPDIYLSTDKEPHYFALTREEVNALSGPDVELRRGMYITDIHKYAALFEPAKGVQAIGEASAMYLYYPNAPLRIATQLPEAKLIAVLRNPVERAYSAYLHKLRDGLEVHTEFGKALLDEPKRIAENWTPLWYYRELGFYYKQLKRYYDLFNPMQLRVYLYDDFKAAPLAVVKDIYGFLGVDDSFIPDMREKRNVSGIPRNRFIYQAHQFLKRESVLKTKINSLLPEAIRIAVKRIVLNRVVNKNLHKPLLSAELHQQLLDDYYEDILQLQGLIGRDLSHWRLVCTEEV